MSRFEDRLSRDLQRIAERAAPSRPQLDAILGQVAPEVDDGFTATVIRLEEPSGHGGHRRGLLAAAVATVVVVVMAATVVLTRGGDEVGPVITDQPTPIVGPTALEEPTPGPTVGPTPTAAATQTAVAVPPHVGDWTWTRRSGPEVGFPSGERIVLESVAFGNGVFVAAGATEVDGEAEVFHGAAEIWASTDGRSWARGEMPDAEAGEAIRSIAFTGDGFVAVGERSDAPIGAPPAGAGMVWTSPDGRAWNRHVPREWERFRPTAVTATPEGYLAVGVTGRFQASIWHSTDTIAWTQVAVFDEPAGISLSDVTGGPGGYVAGGRSGEAETRRGLVLWSADGRAWEQIPGDEALFPVDSELGDVTQTQPGGFIATGMDFSSSDRASLWTSENGRDWRRWPTRLDGPQNLITAVASSPSGETVVAVGEQMANARVWQIATVGGGPSLTAVPSIGTDIGESATGIAFSDRTIVVIGYLSAGERFEVTTWTATPS